MRDLDRLRVERLPQELDTGPERRLERGEVERLSAELARSAVRIPEAAGDVGLDEEGRREFVGLAQELHERASRLAEASGTASPVELRVRLREIDANCVACHRRFRIAPEQPAP